MLVALATTGAPGGGSVGTGSERLSFSIAADGSVTEALRAHLAPGLAAQAVQLDLTQVAAIDVERLLATATERDPGAPLARAWLDGRDPQAAVLFLIPRLTDRVLVRKVPLKNGFDAVALAEIAYIVDRAVASLLAAEPIGVPRAEARVALAATPASSAGASPGPPPTAPVTVAAPASPAPAPTRLGFHGGAFAGLSAWAPDASAVLSAGVSLGVERLGPSVRAGLMLAAAARQSFEVPAAPTSVRVGGGDVRVFLTVGRKLGAWGIGRFGVGPGLVVARVEPVPIGTNGGGQVIEARPRTDVDLALAALLRWDVPLGRVASLFIAATVDVVPVRGEYTATVNGVDRTLLAPWPVRPGLLGGVAVAR